MQAAAVAHARAPAPVDVMVLVDGLDGQHCLRHVELCLLLAQDVLAHEQRLQGWWGGIGWVGAQGLM